MELFSFLRKAPTFDSAFSWRSAAAAKQLLAVHSVALNKDLCLSVPPVQPHALLQRVKSCISDEEEEKLMQITSLHSLNAFLLPIKTVGVQVTHADATWRWDGSEPPGS